MGLLVLLLRLSAGEQRKRGEPVGWSGVSPRALARDVVVWWPCWHGAPVSSHRGGAQGLRLLRGAVRRHGRDVSKETSCSMRLKHVASSVKSVMAGSGSWCCPPTYAAKARRLVSHVPTSPREPFASSTRARLSPRSGASTILASNREQSKSHAGELFLDPPGSRPIARRGGRPRARVAQSIAQLSEHRRTPCRSEAPAVELTRPRWGGGEE